MTKISPERLQIGSLALSLASQFDAEQGVLDGRTLEYATRAVVILPTGRSNGTRMRSIIRDAADSAEVRDRTVIVAPDLLRHYTLNTEDIQTLTVEDDLLYWHQGSSTPGDPFHGETSARSGAPIPRSSSLDSFEVVEALLAYLDNPTRFPNLKRIAIAGYDSGAEFANCFAAGRLIYLVISTCSVR